MCLPGASENQNTLGLRILVWCEHTHLKSSDSSGDFIKTCWVYPGQRSSISRGFIHFLGHILNSNTTVKVQEVGKGASPPHLGYETLGEGTSSLRASYPASKDGNSITLASVLQCCLEQVSWWHRRWSVTHPEFHSSQVICGGLSEMPAH